MTDVSKNPFPQPGDRVVYVGLVLVGSGDPSLGVPDLAPGETGTVARREPGGGVVVSFDKPLDGAPSGGAQGGGAGSADS